MADNIKMFLSLLLLLVSFQSVLGMPQTGRTVSGPQYRLRSNSTDNRFNDLYLVTYHTGAGFNDATFTLNREDGVRGFLNGTFQQFDLGTSFPWGMYPTPDTNYAFFEPVEINAGYGSPGFGLNSSGLQWGPSSSGFGGWLICDWYHHVPQLFYRNRYYEEWYPCNCAPAYLEVERAD